MNAPKVVRYAVLVLSATVMAGGVLIMLGVLVPRNFSATYGDVAGATVFLYGAYRFVVAYYHQSKG